MRLVKDIQNKVVRCPVCGKRPKVSISGACGIGWYCRIKCKPLFRKPHLDIESGKAALEHAVSTAVDIWNEEQANVKERCCSMSLLINGMDMYMRKGE